MVDLVQKEMTLVWAETGDIIKPDDTKISDGWDIELVPRQWWNWMQNRVDHNIAYLLQKGFPEWRASVEYIVNKSYVQYLNVVYKCIQTHTNKTPAVGPYWVKAFAESSVSLEALRPLAVAADKLPYFSGTTTAATTTITAFARSILDDTSATAVRTTIGAQAQDATLQALSDLVTGTNKLPYFTGVDTATVTDLTAFGRSLIDDADAEAARTTLGLGTGAVANVTTSATDTTVGRILKVGDFGIGTDSQPTNIDPNTVRYGSVMAPVSQANAPITECIIWSGGRSAGARSAQLAIDHGSTARAWIRGYNSGRVGAEWGTWNEIWTTNNFAPTDYLLKTGGQLTGALTINAPASQLTLKSTSDGVAATSYVSFYQSSGARDGYVGVASSATTNIYLQADTGDILLYPTTADKAVIAYCGGSAKFRTKATGVTVTGECLATTFVGDGAGLTNLNAADIAAGTLPVVRGGTGVTTSTGTGSVVLSASPTLTGVPLAPTAAAGTNTTQLATTAFVLNQADDTATNILMDGVQSAGTLETYARSNHRHPTDTSRAPTASPTFTGVVNYASLGLGATAVNVDTITGNGVITNVSASTTGTFLGFQAKTGTLITYTNGTARWQLHNPGVGYLWFRDYNGSAWTAWTTFVPTGSANLTGGSVSFSGNGAISITKNSAGLIVTRSSAGTYIVNGAYGLAADQPAVAISNNGRVILAAAAGAGGVTFITYPYNTATPTDSPYVCVILGV